MTEHTDDAVATLLGQAAPRPAPPAEDQQQVRAAVRAEWLVATGQRKSRRRVMHFAIAATVLLAVALGVNQLRVDEAMPVQVAAISKSYGSIYLLGEQSELQKLPNLAVISAGQTIVTGSDAGIGLDWGGGGSLRIDADTRIEFVSTDTVFLRSGRIYFDSQVAAITGSGDRVSTLQIETDHGRVRHLGTQYMTYVDEHGLSVSVREGEVAIDGDYYDQTAVAGQRLTLSGSSRPNVVNIKGYGDAWQWIESTAPATQLDGKSAREFLHWVSRETGLQLEFESEAAKQLANATMLRGTVATEPTNALRVWMMGVDLDWRVQGGVIYVSAIDSGSGR